MLAFLPQAFPDPYEDTNPAHAPFRRYGHPAANARQPGSMFKEVAATRRITPPREGGSPPGIVKADEPGAVVSWSPQFPPPC